MTNYNKEVGFSDELAQALHVKKATAFAAKILTVLIVLQVLVLIVWFIFLVGRSVAVHLESQGVFQPTNATTVDIDRYISDVVSSADIKESERVWFDAEAAKAFKDEKLTFKEAADIRDNYFDITRSKKIEVLKIMVADAANEGGQYD